MNPFLNLHQINNIAFQLLNIVERMDKNVQLKNNIKDLLRKSLITSILSDQYIIAITGLQGVGKTTFIKELYDLNTEDLMINQGQGELLPVLITEKKNTGIKWYVHKFPETGNLYDIKKEEISREIFNSKSHDYDNNDIFLEIEVPEKVFFTDTMHFLLLPGFEREDSYLKSLTETAVRSASNFIYIFQKETYAKEDNKKKIEILFSEFQLAKPMIIISKCDYESQNDKDFKENVRNDLKIKEEESDRIIFSGIPGFDNWKQKVIDCLRKYRSTKRQLMEAQIKNLRNLLNEFDDLRLTIECIADNFEIELENDDYKKIKIPLKIFDECLKNIRETYEKNLKKLFNFYYDRIRQNINDHLKNETILDRVIDIFRNPIAIDEEFKDIIKNAIDTTNKEFYHPEELLILNLNEILTQQSDKLQPKYRLPVFDTEARKEQITKEKLLIGIEPDSKNNTNDKEFLIKGDYTFEKIKADWSYLLQNPTSDIEKKKTLVSEHFETSLSLLPSLALEAMRFSLIFRDQIKDFNKQSLSNNNIKPSKEILDLVKMYQENKKEFAIGLGVLLGLDIAEGGGIDLFGLLQRNALLPTAEAGMSVATFNYVLAILAASAGIIFAINQCRKTQVKRQEISELVINNLFDSAIDEYMQLFDTYMNKLRSVIVTNLREKYGISEKIAVNTNIYYYSHQLKKVIIKTNQEANEYGNSKLLGL